MIRTIIIAASFAGAAFGVVGCTTATPPYAAATTTAGAGYAEQQIESNRYSVTFRAPQGGDANLLQDYAMLRAADLTLAHNHDWFWVDRRALDDEGALHQGPTFGIGVGGASFGRHSAAGVGVGLNFPIGGHSEHVARAATVEIRFGEGPKPDAVNAYDAHSLSTTIRARLAGQ